jgi:hypothetical protein
MWSKNLTIITLALSISLNLLISSHIAYAQLNQNRTDNITSPLFTPIDNMTTGTSSNASGIMQNTSGIIDDAFGALKDTFGSFFGK